jgi:predicted RNA polymerase sigma factor
VTTATSELLGAVVRRYGDFDSAEDATQEALLAAAVQWPQDGVPDYPLGRLITVASRRLTDLLRAEQARSRGEGTVASRVLPADWHAPAADAPSAADDTLVLLFLCCHPALSSTAQIALTLRAVGGLTPAGVARAFLVSGGRQDAGASPAPSRRSRTAGRRSACRLLPSSSCALRR